jgi:hypothetical protein
MPAVADAVQYHPPAVYEGYPKVALVISTHDNKRQEIDLVWIRMGNGDIVVCTGVPHRSFVRSDQLSKAEYWW